MGYDPKDQLARLGSMDLEALRRVWREIAGPPPKLRSADILRRMIAWRLQARREGDLDARTKLTLRRGRSQTTRRKLEPGTVLVRDYEGRRYRCQVTSTGVECEGVVYPSLSAAARAITGVRWNGPRFFGLAGA